MSDADRAEPPMIDGLPSAWEPTQPACPRCLYLAYFPSEKPHDLNEKRKVYTIQCRCGQSFTAVFWRKQRS